MGQEGGEVEPTQADAWRGRCADGASSVERDQMVMVGRKGTQVSETPQVSSAVEVQLLVLLVLNRIGSKTKIAVPCGFRVSISLQVPTLCPFFLLC